nr:PREDICTED: uncharacterized protein LOC108197345 isoform X3 [Daucus carota subsp. sativus]
MSSPLAGAYFKRGDPVEVLRPNLLFSPATVLQPPGPTRRHHYFVQFQTPQNHNTTIINHNDDSDVSRREYVSVADVRPVPPVELNALFMIGEAVDGFFDDEGWRRGRIREILENSRYEIVFGEGNLVKEFDQWNVRRARVWDDGCWDPPIQLKHLEPCVHKSSEMIVRPSKLKVRVKHPRQTLEDKFPKGMLVEVKSDEKGFAGAWYTAKVIGPVGNDMFLVEYQTLKTEDKSGLVREQVSASCIRPCPSELEHTDCFKELEQVDAMIKEGWWVGHISRVLSDSVYLVYFASTEEEMLFERSELRSHQEWVDGNWVSANKQTSATQRPKLQFKVKCNGKTSEPKFSRGTMVEVRSDEAGYHGSWYTAVITDILKNDKYMIEYQTLRTEDEAKLLKEKANISDVRPAPPKIQRVDRFKMLEEVDAWYNDGWWMGHISKILDGFKYLVYFWTTNEEIEFHHFKLRPRQEWIFGKWNFSLRESKLPVNPTISKLKIPCGKGISPMDFDEWAKVEVKSSKDYYEGLWFPAIVVRKLKYGKYLVEFLTLATADAAELLREEADALMMRPCPPVNQRADQYKPLEEVDAWYRGGWSVGHVCKVFSGSKYTIYFRSTNEVLEFKHSYLRPHQDWMNGEWIKATRGRNFMSCQ